jgi:ATP-dependent RNA helicase RhlE
VRKIISVVSTKRQTLLFSATIPPEVKTLAAGILNHPKIIQIGQEHNPIETITQHIYAVPKEQKMDVLLYMLQKGGMYSVLVFSRTKHGADKISYRLERAGIKSVAIHSGRTQGQRRRALDGFKQNKFQVMVATDIAARGIDVEGISHVINFDVPAFAEDYIHRIGRTGRAEAKGDAITFVARDEEKYLRQIERFISRRFKMEKCPGFIYNVPDSSLVQSESKSKPAPHKHQFTTDKKRRPRWRRR